MKPAKKVHSCILLAPLEDLKVEYCTLSLDGKIAMLARESITGKQIEHLLSTVR